MNKRQFCKCGKETFATRDDAQRALANIRRLHKNVGSVYKCEDCEGFHVTHMPYHEGKDLRTKRARKKGRK